MGDLGDYWRENRDHERLGDLGQYKCECEKRRAKQLRRVAKLSARIARIRADWQHKITTDIADRFSLVVIENLAIKNMTVSAKGTIDAPGRNVR